MQLLSWSSSWAEAALVLKQLLNWYSSWAHAGHANIWFGLVPSCSGSQWGPRPKTTFAFSPFLIFTLYVIIISWDMIISGLVWSPPSSSGSQWGPIDMSYTSHSTVRSTAAVPYTHTTHTHTNTHPHTTHTQHTHTHKFSIRGEGLEGKRERENERKMMKEIEMKGK